MRPDGRATVKRKWSADKTAGPLVLLAEWLQKRLIQHAWPCDIVVDRVRLSDIEENADVRDVVRAVRFVPYRGASELTSEFWDAFDVLLRIVAYEKRLRAYRDGDMLHLDGVYHVNKYGVIRPGPMPPPF